MVSCLRNSAVSLLLISLQPLFLEQVTKVIVYIEETNSMADVTFPSLPHVVSLLHYDKAARTADSLHPLAGYPVICVTVSQTYRDIQAHKRLWRYLWNLTAQKQSTWWTAAEFVGFFSNEVAGPNQNPHPLGVEGTLLSLRSHTFSLAKVKLSFRSWPVCP